MITPSNQFRVSTLGNTDLALALTTPWSTESERIEGAEPDFVITTRMSERELRYLLELYFGGQEGFFLKCQTADKAPQT